MYAIVDISGQQFKVEKNQKLFVHRLEGEEGSKVTFDKVFLINNDSEIKIGDPVVAGASISATILGHLKGDKVLVFKKKRRKGYKKLTGHRQYLSQIQIEGISEKSAGTAKAAPAKKSEEAEAKETASAAVEKKAAPKKEAAAGSAKKTSAPKKETPAGEAEKKTAATPKKTAAKPKAAAAKPKAEGKKSAADKPAKSSDAGKDETKK